MSNRTLMAVLACTLAAGAVAANAQAAAKIKATADTGSSPAQRYFSDTVLLDQHGNKLRFYSDLLKGNVVVINTFFATCTSVCSPLNHRMEKIQEWLGDRLGSEVRLISISVDPITDTPPKLAEYAQGFHARPGWYFLTGQKENVDFILKKLGQYTESKEDHLTIILIGNEPTGLWKKAFGLAAPDDLIKVVDSVVRDNK